MRSAAGWFCAAALAGCGAAPTPIEEPVEAPVAIVTAAPAEATWRELFDGGSLTGLEVTSFGGEGEVVARDGALWLDFGSPLTGVTAADPAALPGGDYELEVTAARVSGNDFFVGLTFPVGAAHLTLILGGWGGSVCGLSSLDGADAARNETRTLKAFEAGRDYTARLIVTADAVQVTLDGAPFLAADLRGRALSLRPEVELSRPLGLACFSTRSRVRALRWRPLAATR
ncbi:MAG: DUF1080 domain-containing protein [Planctomycetes bacterium]|nr:DUF1080 domain-containing protein [Planctomycetota bacterium]